MAGGLNLLRGNSLLHINPHVERAHSVSTTVDGTAAAPEEKRKACGNRTSPAWETQSTVRVLGHRSVKVTEKYYSAWNRNRQEQLEADVRRTWSETQVET